jgi:hypothetical protein
MAKSKFQRFNIFDDLYFFMWPGTIRKFRFRLGNLVAAGMNDDTSRFTYSKRAGVSPEYDDL